MKIGGGSGNRISPPSEPPKNEGVVQPSSEKTSDTGVDLEETQDIYVDPKALRAMGIGAGAVAVGAGVAAGAIVGSQGPVDPSYFDHLNIRDKPINETAILFQHNAGTAPGSIPIIATNQTMGIGDVLDKTPVRGFELDLHYRDGEAVLNHGGLFNPLEESPSIDTAINPIADFLNQPGNDNEVVYIMMETYLGSNGTNDALVDMQNAFGSKLYTPTDHQAFWNANGRWPTSDELTANGPRVVVISNNTGSGAGVAFGRGYMGQHFDHTWEDRSGVGMMGSEMHPEIVGEFDTTEFDQLVENGGFIKMDQISPNDPRFFKPEDRDELAARPDVSVAGFFNVSDETATAVAFGAGITASVGAATFGLASGIYEGISNEKLIRNVDKHMCQKLQEIEFTDIAQQKLKKGATPPLTIDKEDLEDHCRSHLKKDIVWKTLSAGVMSTVSIAGGFLGLAMLFPPVFPILSGIAIGTLAVGLVSTLAAAIINRQRMDKAFDGALERGNVQHQTANRQKALQDELSEIGKDQKLLEQKLSAKKEGNILKRASQYLLAGTLLFRISSMAKYTVALVGKISWIATGVITAISSAISSIVNYRDRQKRLEKLADTTAECVMPQLDAKRFWLFGSTKFENFVEKNQDLICAALQKEPGTKVKDLIEALNKPGHEKTLTALRLKCSTDLIQKELKKFAKKKKVDFDKALQDPNTMKDLMDAYAIKKVAEAAHSDTMSAGVANTFKVAAVVGSLSFLFPPVTGFLLIAAAGSALVGLVFTKVAAVFERRKFRKAMEKALKLQEQPAADDIPAQIAHHQSEKLKSFTTYLAQELCKSDALTKAAFHKESAPTPTPENSHSSTPSSQSEAPSPQVMRPESTPKLNAPQASSPTTPKVPSPATAIPEMDESVVADLNS